MFKKLLAATALMALVAAGCGGDDDDATSTTAAGSGTTAAAEGGGTPATGEPILLGAVASYSGVDIFPESPEAAKAVFERVNKTGGINGRPIEYLVEDDKDTPEGATSAAKRLVEEKKVLAMVGGGSIVDCTTNAKYYKEKGILALGGVSACGPDAGNFASANTGPFLGILMTFEYMINDMGKQNICYSALNVGLTPILKDVFLPVWEKTTGHKLKALILSEPNEDLTAAVTKAKSEGCDGVLLGYTEPNYIAYAQIAQQQGLLDGKIQYAMLTSGYSDNVLKKLGKGGEGWITNSEFEPYTDDKSTSEQLKDFKALMKETKQTETSFAQGGYISATAMVEVLKSIDGDITTESLNTALKAMDIDTGLMGANFKWIPYEGANQANTTSKIVQIKDGKWVTISDWQFWPPKK